MLIQDFIFARDEHFFFFLQFADILHLYNKTNIINASLSLTVQIIAANPVRPWVIAIL